MTIESLAMRGKLFAHTLYANHAQSQLGTAGVGTGQGAGTPLQLAHTGYTGLVGVAMAAAADEVAWFLDPKGEFSFIDFGRDIQAEVIFEHSATDADTPVWKAFMKGIAKQAALSDPDSSSDGSITWAAHTCSTTDNSLEVTTRRGFKLTADVLEDDEMVIVNLECDSLGSASANEIILIGLRLYGTLKMTNDPPIPRQLT